ncbi:MAG: enoyl-CoA hydratase/isomerase family protein [Alphaproteobacteria bacterium]|nr:enoyl-CoA hydratase/isomerase family protein [Alphaproteobacteria bacterium]MBL7096316.1 enoyl-CoA hydratase/isomerase family protein [Alphaproteobacteria bacterium]
MSILEVEEIGEIRRVVMNRPERLNALNQPMAEELLRYFEARRRDTAARVIILTGAGRGFTAGADLKALGQADALQDGPNGDWTLRDVMKAMRACPQPIISLVRGPAAGGGLALALASDVIVAGESAVFHSAFIKIGLSGAELGAAWRLQRTMGISRAREALLTGRPIDAQEAWRTGLVSSVLPDAALDAHGLTLAKAMCEARPDALRLTKRSLDAGLEMGSDAAMELEERAQMLMIARRPR